jgi:hypothetical protein
VVPGGGCDVAVASHLHDPDRQVAQGGHGLGAVSGADLAPAYPAGARGYLASRCQVRILDALWTFYGALVQVAMSTPVSLASFASLAWDASKYAVSDS